MTNTRAGRHRAARPSPRPMLVGAVWALSLAAPWATPATATDPGPIPGSEAPALVADGPFGRVEGLPGVPSGAVPDPDDLPVLDAWARGTTMIVRPTEGTLTPWKAVALVEPGLVPADAADLGTGDGDATIHLSAAGLFLIGVDGTIRPDGGALDGTWWWRVAVPNRDLPVDEVGPPPPAIRLGSGDHAEALEQGSGCFLGTCGDIGRVSPPDRLPTVRTIPGAPLSIALEDGSGITDWWVTASPVGSGGADGITLGQARDIWTTQAWVPAPSTGEWVITVSVTFDRERGNFDGYGRLVVGPPPVE